MSTILKKTLRNPSKTLSIAIDRLLTPVGHYEYKKFIVLARSRTGSNMLISFLNSHPQIKADGELAKHLSGMRVEDTLASIFSKQPFYIKARGLKICYNHPLHNNSGLLWRALTSVNDLTIIQLRRRNLLRAIVSHKIAETLGIWALHSEKQRAEYAQRNISVSFKVNELLNLFENSRTAEERGKRSFENHSLIVIYYEDLVADTTSTFQQITNFLGVPYREPRTTLIKQNTSNLKGLVSNYAELSLAFAGTEWERYFED